MNSKNNGDKKRILIVDDHAVVREGLKLLINRDAGLVVCGEAEEAHEAREAVKTLKPDAMILDLSLRGINALELIKTLKDRRVKMPILVLSMHDESLYAERVFRAGAQGYIMKQEASEKVLTALREVLRGGLYASDFLKMRMLQKFAAPSSEAAASPVETLSDRELEVFEMIGEGLGTRQIADKLCVSIKTVESYRAHIKDKLALEGASQLVREAIEWAHVKPSRPRQAGPPLNTAPPPVSRRHSPTGIPR